MKELKSVFKTSTCEFNMRYVNCALILIKIAALKIFY